MIITTTEAKKLILNGQAPTGLVVAGDLDLSNTPVRHLPAGLRVQRALILDHCAQLLSLPRGLHCYALSLVGTPICTLPDDLQVTFRIDASECQQLATLPAGLSVTSLVLRDCFSLQALPEGLDVCFLDISGCTNLSDWPLFARLQLGRFTARNCVQLAQLPAWVRQVTQLDVRGCVNLRDLPAQLFVQSWLDIGNTPISSLPPGCENATLRWNGVRIEPRIAFQPETISVDEILHEKNVELRRVLLERVGYETFMAQVDAKVRFEDRDAGGVRRLLHVAIPADEDLVCLAVTCPSTGRHYLIRVPPRMETCQQAAAWIAGFDDPALYRPLVET